MKYYDLPGTDLRVSAIALGCMRFVDYKVDNGKIEMKPLSDDLIEELLLAALEEGINLFDHADIYGSGLSEELFGRFIAKHPQLRKNMIIQTKCRIRNGYYDLSKEHIIESVEKSIERLNCDYLDILLLHRPDALMDVRDIAEAFDYLYQSGKVHYFGVSNMNANQIRLLQKHANQKIIINQLKFNVVHATMIDQGLNVNMCNEAAINRDGGVLEYCMSEDIMIQAWSILQISWERGTYLENDEYISLNAKLEELAIKYGISKAAIATAWILRHPSNMQAICGTTSTAHLRELCEAVDIVLSKKEWYELYLSVNRLLP